MLGFVQNWFGQRSSPIGVDFGTDCLRMAQVSWVENDWRMMAAATAEVPASVRQDPAARWAFFTQTTRDLLVRGKFTGKTVMLGLPAASTCIQHIRMAKMDSEQLKRALPWEARGKLPFDPAKAVLRHVVAGEVYVDQEARNEVIVMAAQNETVEQMLQAAAKARLDVIGMNPDPMAVLDCFTQVYRRQADVNMTNCFVDIGSSGTRAFFTRGRELLFARAIPIGGDHFTEAVSDGLCLSPEEARVLRLKLAASQPAADAKVSQIQETERVEEACRPLVAKVVEELDLCRRYYEATFPGTPCDRLVFVGGEARQRSLCHAVARDLGVAAQIGDPMCRMNKWSNVGIESGIDRRQPQPGWAVAIGLSMGPPQQEKAALAASNGESRSTHERV